MHVAPVVPAQTIAKPVLSIAPVGALPSEDRALPLRPATPPTGAYVRVSATGAAGGVAAASDTAKRPIATVEVRTRDRLVTTKPFEGGTLRVGRGRDNEIVLVDDRVSRHHGQFTTRRGVLVYADLGSTNGSFLNGTRVHEIVLGSGDVVRLGNSTLTIKSQS
jgi:pSer/pThr/pTyr-binding forkhead associated (FHA) protein